MQFVSRNRSHRCGIYSKKFKRTVVSKSHCKDQFDRLSTNRVSSVKKILHVSKYGSSVDPRKRVFLLAEIVNREESMGNVTMQCLATDANLLYTFIHRSRHDYFSVNWLLKKEKKKKKEFYVVSPSCQLLCVAIVYGILYIVLIFLLIWQQMRLSRRYSDVSCHLFDYT